MAKRGFSKMMWGGVIILVAVLFFVSVYGVREGFTDFNSTFSSDNPVLKFADSSGNITVYTSSNSTKDKTYNCYTKLGFDDDGGQDDPSNNAYYYNTLKSKKKGGRGTVTWGWELVSTNDVK